MYSTIRDKVSSYQPLEIEPSVMDTRYYPLSFSYRARSLISNLSVHRIFPRTGELSSRDREDMAEYLEVNLSPLEEERYRDHLNSFLPEEAGYMERITAILNHYREYQYELGFTDDVSIPAISDFLFNHRSGDCTEFSNSAAILARLAGIPSRVVTGYLVSDGLQTNAHRQALGQLREQFPPLEKENPSDLYLVTTVHRHSWAQFYLPVYGWVDFEATSSAIPPQGGMDPNSLNVVIPDLQERTVYNRRIPIPWELLGTIALIIALLTAGGLYSIRWGRIIMLGIISRGSSEASAKALYRLLLVQLHAKGWELKRPDQTPKEYAGENPLFGDFARLYTRILYAPGWEAGQTDPELREKLRKEYRKLLKSGDAGPIPGAVKRILRLIFGLRDMRYL
ncbi:transglutaminase-like domain-containing protein [Salinispira pacifica]|uniref:Putative cysteine protease n=1 Tax=Salinispira pacifica TaxID=1307761 RepID=V5WJP3_9SPIO|nr:transglutaminase-like domain-containing protein [Salinispira pacifica]AHC15993.1 Putative cysteine protease [Salinispira pacifica]